MNDLAGLLYDVFSTHLTNGLERFISSWPADECEITEEDLPALPVQEWLVDLPALANGNTVSLVGEFIGSAAGLRWRQSYTASDFGAEFVERYGYVEIVGKRSTLFTDQMAGGLLMFGPGIRYPEHRHPAEEIYLPVAGTADYLMSDGTWQSAKPGTVIHNAPMVWHGIRTTSEPVLIAWAWLGGDPAIKSDMPETVTSTDQTAL
jgi:quercetin dioxygenase-like cupin family protein